MRRAAAALFVVLVSAGAALGSGLLHPAAAANHTVTIGPDGSYSPASEPIQAGDTVTWTNSDTKAHTATSDQGVFDTGEIPAHGSVTRVFNDPGTYPYHDADDPARKFHGTVVVTGQSSTTTVTFQQTTTTTASKTTTTTARSTTTSATSSTTSSTLPPTTFPFNTVPGPSTTTTLSGAATGPQSHSGRSGSSSVAGPGLLAALLLLGTSGATLLAVRRGR